MCEGRGWAVSEREGRVYLDNTFPPRWSLSVPLPPSLQCGDGGFLPLCAEVFPSGAAVWGLGVDGSQEGCALSPACRVHPVSLGVVTVGVTYA